MADLKKLIGKKVAIFGGAGFIGHNLAICLKNIGAIPHIVDGLSVNNIAYHSSQMHTDVNSSLYLKFIDDRLSKIREHDIPLSVFDLRDYHLVSKEISEIEPDFVIHLAAVAHANRSNKDPYSTFDHSLRTLENVLDSIKDRNTRLVYFSSSMVYGNFDGAAVSEDSHCNPMGIYGALKYSAEKLVIAYSQVFDTEFVIIRPSALYGERCVSRRVGQAFIENAIRGKDLVINGDGSDALDFTYIQDLINGVMLSLVSPNARNETFNITFGDERTLVQMAELVQEEFPGTKIHFNPRDVLMPERGTLDISKAKSLLGYKPEYPLEIGFIKYIDWYKSFMDGKNLSA